MSRLEKLLGEPAPIPAVVSEPFWDSFGLETNPFPPNRTILPEILYDQDEPLKHFARLARELLSSSSPQRRALAVVAGTGGGKTHFLRFCQREFQAVCSKLGRRFATIEVVAGVGKVADIVRQIVAQADTVCRKAGEADLASALARKVGGSPDPLLSGIQVDDLQRAVRRLSEAAAGAAPPDRAGLYTFETLREVFFRWLQGGSLSQTERKYLGVLSRIGTAPLAVRIVREVLRLMRNLGLIEGLLLCIDEMETLFGRAFRPAQYQAFLQDLRYLYDEAVRDGEGYSLLLLTTATTTGADTLREVNYPVYQRLAYEGDGRVSLAPIGGVVEARQFAHEYINHFNGQWKDEERNRSRKPQHSPTSLLSDTEIEEAYRAATASTAEHGGKVPQGPLLDVLHRKVEQKHLVATTQSGRRASR